MPDRKFGTPARPGAKRGLLGAAPANLMPNYALLVWAAGQKARSSAPTARQSRDLLLISGRADCVKTPAPSALPPKHCYAPHQVDQAKKLHHAETLKLDGGHSSASGGCTPMGRPFNFLGVTRARGTNCGSFPPSLRSLSRSPSAPRKCHSQLPRWSESASAPTTKKILIEDCALTKPSAPKCPPTLHGYPRPFSGCDQKRVVESPFLNSGESNELNCVSIKIPGADAFRVKKTVLCKYARHDLAPEK